MTRQRAPQAVHLDFEVDEIESKQRRVLHLGATLQQDFIDPDGLRRRVYSNPIGPLLSVPQQGRHLGRAGPDLARSRPRPVSRPVCLTAPLPKIIQVTDPDSAASMPVARSRPRRQANYTGPQVLTQQVALPLSARPTNGSRQ
ncbi:VOC family protein [Sphaerisporangium sp. NPDC004334]